MQLPNGGRFTVLRKALNPQQAMRFAMNDLESFYPGIEAVKAAIWK